MLLILAGCGPGPVDSAAVEEELPFPQVWGVEAAEDMDRDPNVVEVHLRAEVTKTEWIDGTKTTFWTYNGQFPGPLIQARVGDTLRVVFENGLDEPTTIHWHGLRIDNLMDGVPAIQDPVEPGETFVYEFVLPESGSFWYHPHVRGFEQIERGLQGPLVVHEAEPVDIPERFFVLDDAWVEDDGKWGSFNLGASHPMQMHGRLGNRLVVNGELDPVEDEVAAVERWRIVNTTNARTMWVGVEGATWRVIAVDGTLLPEPYETERFQLPIGRRVDIEVIPTGDATLNIELPDTSGLFTSWTQYPVFYGAASATDGVWQDWQAADLPAIREAEQDVELVLNVEGGGADIDWTINGRTYDETKTLKVDGGVPTLIRVKDKSGAEHPFHLHGQFFQVVERNGEPADEPGLMDTVLIGGKDELYLYTEFENPGLWMAHCHILEHAERGMMTELLVK